MESVIIKNKHDKRIRSGHPWVFSNELVSLPGLDAGRIVEVTDSRGKPYGRGFYNPNSLISVRLLNTEKEIDKDFFKERIQKALDYRRQILGEQDIYRLVFGESDFLPGLVIDKFKEYIAVQALSAGMEKRIGYIINALIEIFPDIKGIIEKNSSKLRELEGLELREGVIYGDAPDEFIASENNIKLNLSILEGQKTGYFLDQKINRKFVASISKGLSVLDCFSNQGGFALNAARGGAKKIVGADISKPAVARARKNAALNSFANISFEQADVGEYLEEETKLRSHWDMIILDPPAFARNKKAIPAAKQGYKKINRLALRLINKGGLLVSSSCSQALREDVFYDLIQKEADKLHKNLRLIFRGLQSPDHPIITVMPETQYLKFFVFAVE